MLLLDIITYVASFFIIWFGTGLIVSSIEKISKKLKVSTFAVSFFILGFLTSTPELAVGLTSISQGLPEIFIGNLLGGIIILFLLLIPLFAVAGNGIRLRSELDRYTIAFCLIVIAAPSILIYDGKIGINEGVLLLFLYTLLFYFVQRKKGFLDINNSQILNFKAYSLIDIGKILVGITIIFLSSQIIVDKTIVFAGILGVPPFYVSLLALSLGTNLPELSIGVRSIISGKKDVAFGDYLGSAAVNTFLFDFFTMFHGAEITTSEGFYLTLIFTILGLGLFFYFTRSKNDLSRNEGITFLLIYVLFIILEIIRQFLP